MKVRVSMPGTYMAVDLETERALQAFQKMAELLCGYGVEAVRADQLPVSAVASDLVEPEPSTMPVDPEAPETSGDGQKSEKILVGKPAKILPAVHKKPEESAFPKSRETYSGFLYVKCPKCGKEKGFAIKKEKATDHYHCDNCGARSEFRESLVPLFVNCECGRRFRYLTNMTEEAFDIDCLCGAPVAVRWNEKRKQYETIR